MPELDLILEELRDEKKELVKAWINMWDGSFADIQQNTAALQDFIAEVQANADGLYNDLDAPALIAALAPRRQALIDYAGTL